MLGPFGIFEKGRFGRAFCIAPVAIVLVCEDPIAARIRATLLALRIRTPPLVGFDGFNRLDESTGIGDLDHWVATACAVVVRKDGSCPVDTSGRY